MAFEVVRAAGCDRDLAALFDALVAGYRALGDTLAEAHARAAGRLSSIEATLAGLGRTAFLGRERPDLLPGLRLLVADRTTFAFTLDAAAGTLRVLAILPAGPSPLAPLLRAGGAGGHGMAGSSAPRQSLDDGRTRSTSIPSPAARGR